VEYLVQWKGYPEWEATWEPGSNLKNAREAIEEFEKRRRSEREKGSKRSEAHIPL
jgi:hypothetical protein